MATTWAPEITAFQTALRAVGRAPGTIELRGRHLGWLAVWAGDRDPWTLDIGDLLEYLGNQEWEIETRRSVRSSLRGFYGWAYVTGRVDVDPAVGLPSIKPTPPNPRPLPDREYRRAVMAAPVRVRLMLRLANECGLRRAEVAQIHTVRDLVEDLGGWSLVVHGKGGKDRIVPLPVSLATELRALDPGYAFPGKIDGHLSARWVGKLVSGQLSEGWTMHSGRHRFATKAYAVDHDLFTVQELLGHASPATTRAYVEIDQAAKRRLVDAVAA